MRRPGTYRFENADALDAWLACSGGFANATFVGTVARDGGGFEVGFEVPVDDGDPDEVEHERAEWFVTVREYFGRDDLDEDDLSKPLWLVPATDWFQRVTLRSAGASVAQGDWLVDQWETWTDGDSIVLELLFREPESPQLDVRGAVVEVNVGAPESRPAELNVDPDVVQLSFASPQPEPSMRGVVCKRVDETTWELRRSLATPEQFVELLRKLSQSKDFREASSGDQAFDAESWPDYVTPGRRPWG